MKLDCYGMILLYNDYLIDLLFLMENLIFVYAIVSCTGFFDLTFESYLGSLKKIIFDFITKFIICNCLYQH